MPETAQRTVLVADDSRFFRSMLSYALSEDGIRALVAGSGEEALEILARELPDVHLVLLDLVMPGMNGFEILPKLRALPGAEALPVIIISQYGLNDLERGILAKHGVTQVLPKAASVERILFQVRDGVFPEEREQRRSERATVSIAVTVRTPKATHVTTTFNLSENGMFLVFAEMAAPEPGTGVVVKFWVPDEESICELAARVAWVNAAGSGFRRTHPAGFGVEFDAAPEPVCAAIRRFLAANP